MAFQSRSQNHPRTQTRQPSSERPVTGVRRVLRALAESHRRRVRFDLNRFRQTHGQAAPEQPEHALSWRFGVPVR